MPALVKRDIPTSYAQADALLGARSERKVSANGWLWRAPDCDKIVLTLYRTDIIKWHRDGTREITTNGWWTMTTASWLNRAMRGTGTQMGYVHREPVLRERIGDKWLTIPWDGQSLTLSPRKAAA